MIGMVGAGAAGGDRGVGDKPTTGQRMVLGAAVGAAAGAVLGYVIGAIIDDVRGVPVR